MAQKLFSSFLWLMISLPYIFTFNADAQKPVSTPSGFDWQGHRGCRGLMPENSIPAFLKALDFPEVTTLELDLAVSKDHRLIVSHEPWFNAAICRRENGDSIPYSQAEQLLIYQMTVPEIQSFDCGSYGNSRFPEQQKTKTSKPTLQEVVEAVRAKDPARTARIRWNIEIKSQPEWDGVRHPPVEEFVNLTIAELRKLRIDQSCTVQSFDIRALQAMHRLAPDIQLAFLIENINSFDSNIKKLGFIPEVYSPYYLLVSKKLARKCHHKNMKLIPWTVNDLGAMRGMIKMGVDGIITDFPNLIERVGK